MRACRVLRREALIRPSRRQTAPLLLILAALGTALAATTAAASPRVDAKRAEAEQVYAQIQEIDADLAIAVDRYNEANLKLAATQSEQGLNRRHLEIARSNYKHAQEAIAQRLVALYVEGESDFVEILLGATSLGDLLDRIDTANRISEQDAVIVRDLERAKKEMRKRAAALQRQRARQEELVAERASRRAYIEQKLAERQALLASIESEIEQLVAEERERERRLQAQAQAALEAARSAAAGGDTGAVGVATPVADSSSSPPPPDTKYSGVVAIAMQYLGIPYLWGGASPETGFDCSGFVMYVYAQVGVSLPHHAASQYNYGVPVSRDQLQPGDLVFFDGLGHNGMYVGDDLFIHSPHTGDVVKISSLNDSWYASRWVGARRLL